MSKSSLGKIGPILLGFYVISLIILFFFALLFPSPHIMKHFYIDNAIKWALYYFIEFFIPIHTTAVLIIYSLFTDTETGVSGKGSLVRKLVSSVLVLFMVLTILYIICLLWIHPQIISGIKENETKSELAQNYYTQASSELLMAENVIGEMKEKHIRNAFTYIVSCLRLNPEDHDAKIMETEIRKKIIESNIQLVEDEPVDESRDFDDNRDFIEGMDADGLMEQAQRSFEKEDYFSSYYYASMAFRLDNTRIDAEDLITRAMNKISTHQLSIEDEKLRKLYEKKKEGYNKIVSGEYVGAYYLFKELEEMYPDDPDIKDYLIKVKEEFIDELTFFYEDVKDINIVPGETDIIFINYKDEMEKQFIYVEKMITLREGIFFRNVEIITISTGGDILYHLKAPYGKYVYVDIKNITRMQEKHPTKHHLNLNCIYRNPEAEADEADSLPYYIVSPKGKKQFPEFIIPLYPSTQLLDKLRNSGTFSHQTNLLELLFLSLNNEYEKAGFNRTEINIEIITRFNLPFLFLFCSLIAIALGWVCRSRYFRRPPIFTFIFIPVFPVVIALLIRLYILTQKIIFAFIVIALDIIPALIISLVFHCIVIIIALVLVAGKLTK
ncbi:MAG: hypothetical protein JXJ04_02045 [Spirochaetales bacterium]|nr:hypothetical protein [Spirochaetales bacterium]